MNRFSAFAFALASLLPACGSGGGDPVTVITGLARTAGCTADGLSDFGAVVSAVNDELDKVPVPSVLNVDVVVDGRAVTLTGTIVESMGDLSDGFDPGDRANVVISSLSVDGVVTGSGDLIVSYVDATTLTVSGAVTFTDSSCSVEFNNVTIVTDPTVDGYPNGAFEFVATVGDDTLAGPVSLLGTSLAQVTASLNEGPAVDFQIDLETFEPVFGD